MTTVASTYVSLTGDPETDALLFGTAWRVGAGGTATTTLTYSFATGQSLWPDYGSNSEPTTGFSPLAATAQQAVGNALLAWSTVANLEFQEVADDASGSGTLRIGYTTLGMDASQLAYAYAPTDSAIGGDVWLNAQLEPTLYGSFTPGSLSSYVLIHELGHALGLKHPHAGSDLNGATLGTLDDSIFNTVMSYYAWPGIPLTQTNIDRLPGTPMSFDIDALQALYGANTVSHGGNDVYTYSGDGKFLETLYDTGGNDTIQVTGSRNTEIDLRPDQWSQIGIPVQISGGAIQNPDTVRIYRTTLIENAIGGSGNDTLIGNDLANQLTGSAGNDTILGGKGDDVATLTGNRAGYRIEMLESGTGLMRITDIDLSDGNDGVDQLAGVEALRFGDGSIDTVWSGSTTQDATGVAGNAGTPGAAPLGLVITGAAGNDALQGSPNSDTLNGLGGLDTLVGGLGADTLNGGDGSDLLMGYGRPVVAGLTRVGVMDTGAQTTAHLDDLIFSPDGRFIMFRYWGSGLFTGDANEGSNDQLYAKDLVTGAISRVTTSQYYQDNGGVALNGGQQTSVTLGSMSSDGHLALFITKQPLVASDTDPHEADVYLKDMTTGSVTLVSSDMPPGAQYMNVGATDLSAEGRYVAYVATGTTWPNSTTHVYVKDMSNGTLIIADTSTNGIVSNGYAGDWVDISDDGQWVTFGSNGNSLMGVNSGAGSAIYRKNIQTGELQLVTSSADGTSANDYNYGDTAAVSSTGRFVVFTSGATNLVASPAALGAQVYLKDMQTGAISRASSALDGTPANAWCGDADVSTDGRFVVFRSTSTNLVANDTSGNDDVFVKDMQTGALEKVSPAPFKAGAFSTKYGISISDDGRVIAFSTWDALTSSDTNRSTDVYLLPNPLAPATIFDVDTLRGDGGNDTLISSNSGDVLYGGPGDDLYIVNANASVVELASEGTDSVRSTASFTLPDNVENLTLIGEVDLNGTGNSLANRIEGNLGNNIIDGLAGNDTLIGGIGDDSLIGGAGNDSLEGNLGNDTLVGGAGNDTLDGGIGGVDIAVFGGLTSQYAFSFANGVLSVRDMRPDLNGDDGIDQLSNVEILRFGNADVQFSMGGGGEYRVNEVTPDGQDQPRLCTLSDGSYVAIWRALDADDSNGIYGRKFSITGAPLGGDFHVNQTIAQSQQSGEISALSNGGFVVTWSSYVTQSNPDIFARIYGADGAPVGNEFRVNQPNNGEQLDSKVISLEGGDFVVLWNSYGQDGSAGGIYAQRYEVDGTAVGSEFRINQTTLGHQQLNDVCVLPDGRILVSYQTPLDYANNPFFGVPVGRIFDPTFSSGSAEFSFPNGRGSLAPVAGGQLFSVSDYTASGEVTGQVINADGSPSGDSFIVNTTTDGYQLSSTVTSLLNGNVVVSWMSQDADGYGIYAQIFTGSGTKVGSEFRVSVTEAGYQGEPVVTPMNDGGFVVAWDSPDGSGQGIYARRFAADGSDSSGPMLVIGTSGNDTLKGSSGDDIFIGLGGNDTYIGKQGNDLYFVDDVSDLIVEDSTEGIDSVVASVDFALGTNVENLLLLGSAVSGTGNELDNTIVGQVGNNLLGGAAGRDTLDGGAGNDTLEGGVGADRMEGGSGADTYYVDDAGDETYEADNVPNGGSGLKLESGFGSSIDTVNASINHILQNYIENLNLIAGSAARTGAGNTLDNAITGNEADNTLVGGDGNDTLVGGAGNDTLTGGSGVDIFDYDSATNNGTDIITDLGPGDLIRVSAAAFSGTASVGNGASVGNNQVQVAASGGTTVLYIGTDATPGADIVISLDGTYLAGEFILTGNQFGLRLGNTQATGGITLTGTAASGRTLGIASTLADADGLGTISYTWQASRDGTDWTTIGTASTQVLTNVLIGQQVRAIAGYTDQLGYVESATSPTSGLIVGSELADTATGGAGNDTLDARGGNDTLNGMAGNDQLLGGTGNDTLDGGLGADTMIGGEGADAYVVDDVGDVIIETNALAAAGSDLVQSALSYTLGDNLERLALTDNAINGTGNALANLLTGNAGNNRLDGGAAADTLAGGLGDDLFIVDSPGDVVTEFADSGTDTVLVSTTLAAGNFILGVNVEYGILGGADNLNLAGNASNNGLFGNSGANLLDGGVGNDALQGGGGNDTLLGGAGNDSLDGRQGSDRMEGGAGNDSYYVNRGDGAGTAIGANEDIVVELAAAGTDTVYSAVYTYTLEANVENLVLQAGKLARKGFGNATDNAITGNGLNNLVSGDGGNDTLMGGAGNDTLDGGAGNDRIDGGLGRDILNGGAGADDFVFDSLAGTDQVQDFSRQQGDRLVFDDAVFAGLGTAGGSVDAAAFVSGAGLSAGQDATDRLVFDTATGKLYYDADGSGMESAILVAQLGTASLTVIDCLVA